MFVYYTSDGVIVDVSEFEIKSNNKLLEIREEDIPEDFLATFPLGKYQVKNNKLKSMKKYAAPPEDLITDLLPDLSNNEEYRKLFNSPKRRRKKPQAKKAVKRS